MAKQTPQLSSNCRPALSRPDGPVVKSSQDRRRCHSSRATRVISRSAARDSLQVDVAVVGGGIIGLSIAHAILERDEKLSVALIERAGLCTGATGAGQGYVWMAHRDPDSPLWNLATQGKQLWQQLVDSDPAWQSALEWQDIGSILLGRTSEEEAGLRARQAMLAAAGLPATLLEGPQLQRAEPSLRVPKDALGLLVESDAQLNGRKAAEALLKACRQLGGSNLRFIDLFEEPVTQLDISDDGSKPQILQTASRRVEACQGLVLAAGAWTGQLLDAALGLQGVWAPLFKPRRGHLLEVQQPAGMAPVHHGLMEVSYTQHYAQPSRDERRASQAASCFQGDQLGVTFTACPSACGSLLLGSSREFSGWDTAPCQATVQAILRHSEQYLPGLLKNFKPSSRALQLKSHSRSPAATMVPDHGLAEQFVGKKGNSNTAESRQSAVILQQDAGSSPIALDREKSHMSAEPTKGLASEKTQRQPGDQRDKDMLPLSGNSLEPAVSNAEPSSIEQQTSIQSISAVVPQGSSQVQVQRQLDNDMQVRVGLRPYVVGGVPLVGPLPGFSKVIVAAGHEGSGLTLAPATAEVVLSYLLPDLLQKGHRTVDFPRYDAVLTKLLDLSHAQERVAAADISKSAKTDRRQ